MNNIEVGAFEAKTHFSQLLKEVEQGSIVHVTRRGKPVAVISPEVIDDRQRSLDSLSRIAARRTVLASREKLTTREVLGFRNHGRR